MRHFGRRRVGSGFLAAPILCAVAGKMLARSRGCWLDVGATSAKAMGMPGEREGEMPRAGEGVVFRSRPVAAVDVDPRNIKGEGELRHACLRGEGALIHQAIVGASVLWRRLAEDISARWLLAELVREVPRADCSSAPPAPTPIAFAFLSRTKSTAERTATMGRALQKSGHSTPD